MALGSKQCSICRVTKTLDAFYRQASATDGHQARCKECHLLRVHAYRRRLQAMLQAMNGSATPVADPRSPAVHVVPAKVVRRSTAIVRRPTDCTGSAKNAIAHAGPLPNVRSSAADFASMTSPRRGLRSSSSGRAGGAPYAGAYSSCATSTLITATARGVCVDSCAGTATPDWACSVTTPQHCAPRSPT